MAQGLVGGVWPQGDLADKAICEAIGNSTGIFTDYAAAKHGCGTRGQRTSTNNAGGTDFEDVNPGVPRNYTWHVLKESAFFNPGGTFDRDLAEYAMTLIGTVIYVPPSDDDPGSFVPFAGDASSTLVTALLDGTQGQSVQVFRCDEPDLCLNPTFQQLSLSSTKAIRPRVATMIGNMVEAIREDTAIGAAEIELLQVASLPLYKILTVQAAYGRGMATDDRATLAEVTSIDLLHAILERISSEASRSMASFIAADEAKLTLWRAQVAEVRNQLASRQATGQARITAIVQIIEKTAMIENMLAASMSPSMAAALDWSRGIQSRSIVP
jgi:conjugative transfer pilus assembly protein TraH